MAARTSYPLATTISRGRSTAISSRSACRPSAPAYSATSNSPVERSSSATPYSTVALMRAEVGDDGHQERRLAGFEVVRVGQRPRRDHPHDLALDDALGLPRVLDLLADGDAVALLDQPRDVAVRGVIRARRTSAPPCPTRPSTARSASGRARAPPPARPRRTSRRSRPSGRTRGHGGTAASPRSTWRMAGVRFVPAGDGQLGRLGGLSHGVGAMGQGRRR